MTKKIEAFMKCFMKMHSLTLAEMAKKTNKSTSFIHGMIHGYKAPDDKNVDNIANSLGMSMQETRQFKQYLNESKPYITFKLSEFTSEQAALLAKIKLLASENNSQLWHVLKRLENL
jgi:hypothetical protein